jgi:hypothetical protein
MTLFKRSADGLVFPIQGSAETIYGDYDDNAEAARNKRVLD